MGSPENVRCHSGGSGKTSAGAEASLTSSFSNRSPMPTLTDGLSQSGANQTRPFQMPGRRGSRDRVNGMSLATGRPARAG